ncbi:MAG: hypothetical protein CRN43_06180 [Candidatus Nephrothrix sp. EaCA]|nr:MAG: hypothetical protein CRN43_06180 [Candidatus Nephrothrix sp. EaCA]
MKMKKVLVWALSLACAHGQSQSVFPKIEAVKFSQVQITDNFWKPKTEKIAEVTIPICIEQTEIKTPRIQNFEKVVRKQGEKHEGIYFDDSDAYKAIEAMAYSLKNHPDEKTARKADEWIDKIAAAQQPDGYLFTYYTLNAPDQRWTNAGMGKHEDYCAGHLIEAAVAYYNTTGKRKLLDVAIRFADHMDSILRKQNKRWISGHQEIELALVKLYRTTNNKKYLDLAEWFIEQRGHGYGKGVIWGYPNYCQDSIPVKDQRNITGHAVRAMYLYTGVADVAAAKNDVGYMNAMKNVWEDVVYRNMYITGGIGASGKNEGFTADYDLPNKEAYCETCASVGMVFWNQRMNLLTGEAKYIDILERSLYNAALDGLSLSGDKFFYDNPLASNGGYGRSEWFGCACCPANIARLMASIGDYIYARSPDAIRVNLFVGSRTVLPIQKSKVSIAQSTNYPWDGNVQMTVSPDKKVKFQLYVRIPGWVKQPVPGNAYRYQDTSSSAFELTVNGKPADYGMKDGFAVITREWKKNDRVVLALPMPVRRVISCDSIRENINRVSLQRGPLVYCFEHPDNNGKVMNIVVPDAADFEVRENATLLGGVVTLEAKAPVVNISKDGVNVSTETQKIKAIPYFCWANRGNGEMQVWMPRKISGIQLRSDAVK